MKKILSLFNLILFVILLIVSTLLFNKFTIINPEFKSKINEKLNHLFTFTSQDETMNVASALSLIYLGDDTYSYLDHNVVMVSSGVIINVEKVEDQYALMVFYDNGLKVYYSYLEEIKVKRFDILLSQDILGTHATFFKAICTLEGKSLLLNEI